MLTMAVAWSSTGRVMKYKDNGQFWGFSSPVTMHFTVLHLGPIQNGWAIWDNQWTWPEEKWVRVILK